MISFSYALLLAPILEPSKQTAVELCSQVHRRGRRVIVYAITTLATVLLSLIADGYVDEAYGERRMFGIVTPFTAIDLLLVVLAIPEHTLREHKVNTVLIVSSGDPESRTYDSKEKAAGESATAELRVAAPTKRSEKKLPSYVLKQRQIKVREQKNTNDLNMLKKCLEKMRMSVNE